MQTPDNPNKQKQIQAEFDSRLEGLCGEFKKRLGTIAIASSLVVHTARFCAELGEQFDEVAINKWKECVRDFRNTLQQNAIKESASHDKH